MNEALVETARHALSAFVEPADGGTLSISPLGDGLINDTYLVSGPQRLRLPTGGLEAAPQASVLQRVNPIFGSAVHRDIEAITRHLHHRGLPTPLLYRTAEEELFVDLQADGVWRLLSFIPGRSTSRVEPDLCQEAGRLVGRFHEALSDLSHSFHFSRPGAHDLHAHLFTLRSACERAAQAKDGTPAGFGEVAAEVLERASALPAQVQGPLRICHGDLKISNVRFDEEGRGLCLLDLDTLGHLPLLIEMGDALRSWCNPSPLGEDDPEAPFDLDLFARALAGYGERTRVFLTADERHGLVTGVERICLELAARFSADVIHDRYFRWDPRRFPSRAAHNLVRARGQLSLACSLAQERSRAEAIAARVLGP